MVVVFEQKADEEEINRIVEKIKNMGYSVLKSEGEGQRIIGIGGVKPESDIKEISMIEGVARVLSISEPYVFAGRDFKPENTVINVGNASIGSKEVTIIAGPCAVENELQIHTVAQYVAKAGAKILRGGAYKPRTSPYSFQGLGEDGLKFIRDAADSNGLKVVTEIIDLTLIDMVGKYTDIFQVGARNMYNYPLLKELGKLNIPVLLKRGLSATIDELLMSSEYILAGGNNKVILCERGIRTFEPSTRNTFDISAIPVIQQKSHLPVIADPSHATGFRDMVTPVARAAVAAGADGLIIEVHNDPNKALSDGPQALLPDQFEKLISEVRLISSAIGRHI
ncbi:MAG: 3-deoxy-7-phosphoheptulonate synthase [Ignavibacteriales bacterium]|nr:3-deoxy-7-phosphoheptulonate synthase [Ignavibacteriales bacterium]